MPFTSNVVRFSTVCAFLLAGLPVIGAARAADPATPDWPCIWRKVVELDAGTIWDGPSIEGNTAWNNDDKIRKLSQYLISRRIPLEEAEGAIKKFASELPADTRDASLTNLFAAVLSRTNAERKLVISGIERFHKRQLARAKEIEAAGIALPNQGQSLPTEQTSATEIDKIPEEEEKYRWEVRVFQERQQNIPIACEIPQLMDERAGALARAIRAEMKS
jgi:hypothetical protein